MRVVEVVAQLIDAGMQARGTLRRRYALALEEAHGADKRARPLKGDATLDALLAPIINVELYVVSCSAAGLSFKNGEETV
jgi:hypothetical protein